MSVDGVPLGAESWRESIHRRQLTALLDTGLVAEVTIEVTLGLRPAALRRHVAGDDPLTEQQEIALMRLLEDYRTALREVNVRTAAARLRRSPEEFTP